MKHQTWNHPKLVDLAGLLGVRKHVAAGVVEGLISFACHFAPDGEVGKFPDRQIAAWLDWEGDAKQLFDSLLEAGWLDRVDDDRRFVIHDWLEHRPYFLNRRGKPRKSGAASGGEPASEPVDNHGRPVDDDGRPSDDHSSSHRTEPNRTEPNPTESKSKAADAADALPHVEKLDELIQVYESVPWLTPPRDKRAAGLLQAWKAALTGKRAAEYRELLADVGAIQTALTKSQRFMHDKSNLCRLEWLLKRESNGPELNLAKVLAGALQGSVGNKPATADVGPGKVFDPNNTDPTLGVM